MDIHIQELCYRCGSWNLVEVRIVDDEVVQLIFYRSDAPAVDLAMYNVEKRYDHLHTKLRAISPEDVGSDGRLS